MRINEFQKELHNQSRASGWHDEAQISVPTKLMLMVTEIAEAMEEYRKYGDDPAYFAYVQNGKPEGLMIELADCLIRILDLAGYYDVDMEVMIAQKHEYNKTRSFRHGGKKC